MYIIENTRHVPDTAKHCDFPDPKGTSLKTLWLPWSYMHITQNTLTSLILYVYHLKHLGFPDTICTSLKTHWLPWYYMHITENTSTSLVLYTHHLKYLDFPDTTCTSDQTKHLDFPDPTGTSLKIQYISLILNVHQTKYKTLPWYCIT